jgi:hypothetical protein
MTDFQNLTFEKKNHIGYIALNRPKVLNALNIAIMRVPHTFAVFECVGSKQVIWFARGRYIRQFRREDTTCGLGREVRVCEDKHPDSRLGRGKKQIPSGLKPARNDKMKDNDAPPRACSLRKEGQDLCDFETTHCGWQAR